MMMCEYAYFKFQRPSLLGGTTPMRYYVRYRLNVNSEKEPAYTATVYDHESEELFSCSTDHITMDGAAFILLTALSKVKPL